MQKILASILLIVSSVGLARAQETTGEKGEEARKEIMKIELDKIAIHNANGDATANWDERYNDKDIVNLSKGAIHPKADQIASIRAGKTFIIEQKQYGHKVTVYNQGTVAVVTYRQDATFREDGKPVPHHSICVNVWVKFEDGRWQRIAHIVEPRAESAEKSKD
jgi:ketosteroid isomerase-like protein